MEPFSRLNFISVPKQPPTASRVFVPLSIPDITEASLSNTPAGTGVSSGNTAKNLNTRSTSSLFLPLIIFKLDEITRSSRVRPPSSSSVVPCVSIIASRMSSVKPRSRSATMPPAIASVSGNLHMQQAVHQCPETNIGPCSPAMSHNLPPAEHHNLKRDAMLLFVYHTFSPLC